MTEKKRFQYNVNKNTIEYDGKFVAYVMNVDGYRIANKMNILLKENEQLKQTNQELNDELQKTMGYLALKSGIEKENEQLKKRLIKLKEENAELKDENEKLWCDEEW